MQNVYEIPNNESVSCSAFRRLDDAILVCIEGVWTEVTPFMTARFQERIAAYKNQIEAGAKEIERLRAALIEIAAYSDVGASMRLLERGSYAAFDEPDSVELARKALEQK